MRQLALRTAVVLAATLATLVPASAAHARNIGADDEIVLTGTVRVPKGAHADRILIGDGRVNVAGHVDGVIVALDAPVRISGSVDGDVIALGGRITLAPGAIANNDLIYAGKRPVVPRGAQVYGKIRHVGPGDVSLSSTAFILHVALWLAFTISSLALGLLFMWLGPRAADAAYAAARERAGPAIGLGVALFLGIPIAAIAALLTLVGFPFGMVLLFALLPLYALGYVTTAWVLGRSILSGERGRIVRFLAGWAILRGIAFVPVVGALAWLAATVFGLGLLTVALWSARRSGPDAATPARAAQPAGAGG